MPKTCDHCDSTVINGLFCHEHGCPATPKACAWCGQSFTPDTSHQRCCSEDYQESYAH